MQYFLAYCFILFSCLCKLTNLQESSKLDNLLSIAYNQVEVFAKLFIDKSVFISEQIKLYNYTTYKKNSNNLCNNYRFYSECMFNSDYKDNNNKLDLNMVNNHNTTAISIIESPNKYHNLIKNKYLSVLDDDFLCNLDVLNNVFINFYSFSELNSLVNSYEFILLNGLSIRYPHDKCKGCEILDKREESVFVNSGIATKNIILIIEASSNTKDLKNHYYNLISQTLKLIKNNDYFTILSFNDEVNCITCSCDNIYNESCSQMLAGSMENKQYVLNKFNSIDLKGNVDYSRVIRYLSFRILEKYLLKNDIYNNFHLQNPIIVIQIFDTDIYSTYGEDKEWDNIDYVINEFNERNSIKILYPVINTFYMKDSSKVSTGETQSSNIHKLTENLAKKSNGFNNILDIFNKNPLVDNIYYLQDLYSMLINFNCKELKEVDYNYSIQKRLDVTVNPANSVLSLSSALFKNSTLIGVFVINLNKKLLEELIDTSNMLSVQNFTECTSYNNNISIFNKVDNIYNSSSTDSNITPTKNIKYNIDFSQTQDFSLVNSNLCSNSYLINLYYFLIIPGVLLLIILIYLIVKYIKLNMKKVTVNDYGGNFELASEIEIEDEEEDDQL